MRRYKPKSDSPVCVPWTARILADRTASLHHSGTAAAFFSESERPVLPLSFGFDQLPCYDALITAILYFTYPLQTPRYKVQGEIQCLFCPALSFTMKKKPTNM